MVTTLWSATFAATAVAVIAAAGLGLGLGAVSFGLGVGVVGVEAFQQPLIPSSSPSSSHSSVGGTRRTPLQLPLPLAQRKVVPATVPGVRPDRRMTSRSTAGATTLRRAAASSSDNTAADDTTATITPSSTTTSKTSSKAATYQNFDYTRQWYPVAFARDVPYDTPTQITLFDVDYVISRSSRSRSSSSAKQKDSSTKQQDKSAKQKDKRRVQGSESDDDELIYAVLDRCPHKSASLAEGRVIVSPSSCNGSSSSSSSGDGDDAAATAAKAATRFQCAYHGWSFDGITGQCVDIPQVTASGGGSIGSSSGVSGSSSSKSSSGGGGKGGSVSSGGKSGSSGKSSSGGKSGKSSKSRADTTAIPALVQQGIIYLFPGSSGTPSPTTGTTTGTGTDPNLLQNALQTQPPPRIPELDLDGYRMIPQIRDFPIDWTILLENIMDPDHGLFAHQNVAFDLYSASGDCPIVVSE
eukprot:CAMPEP_0178485104 /NCGR_PEP_ID=MMETSP0696-20121128/8099_1 /TAXON_ID=265572 /ORGANISM="Extubocellulus spinifer, Strain CCMP396" /LENGTH=466 /DNA_ID=CAMNT_0020112685 /DNA_START=28 /DNA_END=1425 /DNA_ORIENTATION=+